jgi:hypothetical protein
VQRNATIMIWWLENVERHLRLSKQMQLLRWGPVYIGAQVEISNLRFLGVSYFQFDKLSSKAYTTESLSGLDKCRMAMLKVRYQGAHVNIERNKPKNAWELKKHKLRAWTLHIPMHPTSVR